MSDTNTEYNKFKQTKLCKILEHYGYVYKPEDFIIDKTEYDKLWSELCDRYNEDIEVIE